MRFLIFQNISVLSKIILVDYYGQGGPLMNEAMQNPEVLTIKETAAITRCSKAHVANLLNGKVSGVPRLPFIQMGRRKLIRRSSLERWMEAVEGAISTE